MDALKLLPSILHSRSFQVKTPFLPSHQSFEKITFQDPLKKLTARALMTFLACSPAAQTHAAQGISPVCLIIQETNVMFPHFCHAFFPFFSGFPAGLIDSCVEQLKQSHSQLNLESVRPHKALHRKKVSRNWMEISSRGLAGGCAHLFFP